MRRLKNENGFAYVMVLAAVVVLAILAETAYVLTSYEVKHDREMELLFRGRAYERAIRNYYLSTPLGQTPSYPRRLEDLLSDPRVIHQQYLRELYADPMGAGWNIVQSADGGIAGVASKSQDKPVKQANFPTEFQKFEGASHYSDWAFVFDSSTISMPVSGSPASISNSIAPSSVTGVDITNAR